jgi:predicted MFS family arabinose efflux permease
VGVGIGLLVAVGIAAAGEWPEPDRRPHVLAWAIAGMPAAWITSMPVVGVVADVHWRAAWIAVPTLVGLAALALVRMRPPDRPSTRTVDSVGAWRRPDVARFAAGELLANAAWASVLTYAGALLLGSYPLSPTVVALGLGAMAAAMVPGTFFARRHAAHARPGLLIALTGFQGGAVLVLGAVRPAVVVTLGVLAVMAFVNGWRSMIASALGMDTAPEDKLAVMSMRAAANQFGYLLGAAAGGLALAVGGFSGLGATLAGMFAAAVLVHAMSPGVLRGLRNMIPTDLQPAPRHVVAVPSDLANALESAPEALHYFESLPYGRQRRLVAGVEDARTPDARRRRIASAIGRLRTEGAVA